VAEEPEKDASWSLRGKIGAGQGQNLMVSVARNPSHTRLLSSCGSHKSSCHEEESQRTAAEAPSRSHGVVKRPKMARNARNARNAKNRSGLLNYRTRARRCEKVCKAAILVAGESIPLIINSLL
jgi:hypothetical protein